MGASLGFEGHPPGGALREGRRGLVLSLLALVLVPFLLFATMILRNWEPPAPDTNAARPFSAWGLEVSREEGRTPVWYPHIFSGMPSYGSFTFTPRNPLNPIGLLLHLSGGNRGLGYLLLWTLAGLAGFAFLRRQGFSRLASTTAALVFSITPYFPGSVAAGHSTKLEALCLVPALLLAIDLMLERPNGLRAAFLAVVAACLAWSNHPQVAFYGLFVGTLYALGVLFWERRGRLGSGGWIRLLGFLLLGAILALGLIAQPYLGVREYTAYSIRGGTSAGDAGAAAQGVGWDYATAWSFHPKELVSFLFPGWFGLHGETYWGPMPFTQSTHYFGIVALALALFGLVRMGGRRRWIWAGISLAVLLVGFGRFFPVLYGPMFAAVPFFNRFRVPSMIYSLLPVCLAYLVAGGMDALLGSLKGWARASEGQSPPRPHPEKKGKGRRTSSASPTDPGRTVLLLLGGLLLLWIVILLGARAAFSGPAALLRPNEVGQADPSALAGLSSERLSLLQWSVTQGVFFLAGGLLLLVLALRGIWPRRALFPWLGLALAVLVLADPFLVGRKLCHPEPRREVHETIPARGAAEFLARQPGLFRVFPVGQLFGSNAFGLEHLESVGGYHPAKLRVYQDLLEGERITRGAVLKMLNVRYILSPSRLNLGSPALYEGDGYVYAYPDSLPRAWAVRELRWVGGRAAMLGRLSEDSFRPDETALLYEEGPRPQAQAYGPAQVTVAGHGPGRLVLSTEAAGPAFVVLSEIVYPPGWRATVDGTAARLWRVDHVLQGIEVPAGRHEVKLEASSPGMERGIRISRAAGGITGLLVLLGLAGWVRSRSAPRNEV